MFGVLDRYIGRTILNSILMTLFLLVSLSGIIKFVEQLRKVGDGDYTAMSAGVFTLLTGGDASVGFYPFANCDVGDENSDSIGYRYDDHGGVDCTCGRTMGA